MLMYSSFFVACKYFYRSIDRLSLSVHREGANVLGDKEKYDTRQRHVERQP